MMISSSQGCRACKILTLQARAHARHVPPSEGLAGLAEWQHNMKYVGTSWSDFGPGRLHANGVLHEAFTLPVLPQGYLHANAARTALDGPKDLRGYTHGPCTA